jgi:hypothetical protein
MKYIDDWDKTKERFVAFWAGECIDRCSVAVTAPLRGKEDEYNRLKALPRLYGWGDPQQLIAMNRRKFEVTRFAGEAFPGIWLNLGPSGHAGFFKDAIWHMDSQTVWYDPSIADDEYERLVFDAQSSLYTLTISMAEALAEESQGDYLVSMPDTAGNLDALAYLRGNDRLLVDMADGNPRIFSALEQLQGAWERITSEVHGILKNNNDGGGMIQWLRVWAPGLLAQMQVDMSVMISPNMFNTFALPELIDQSNFLEYPLYHLDGAQQVRHLDTLLSLDRLKVIQWTSIAGQAYPSHFLDELKRIQQAGKSLLLPIPDVSDLEPLLTNLSSKGLHIVVEAKDEDQVDDILRMAERLAHD